VCRADKQHLENRSALQKGQKPIKKKAQNQYVIENRADLRRLPETNEKESRGKKEINSWFHYAEKGVTMEEKKYTTKQSQYSGRHNVNS